MDKLKYVFNKYKASATDVKDAFEAMYKGKFKDDIFDTFWKNPDLKAKLFRGLDDISARDVFDDLVKDKKSVLYSILN